MIVLRIFLYLICIFSIGWSVLVFGGPPIIKKIILGYSDGAFKPSGITVSPGLDIRINRLDFIFQSQKDEPHVEGFSRAAVIAWSIFGDKPFLKINLGPSVLKDFGTAKSINIYTPNFMEIDWQNIYLTSDIKSLALNSYAKAHSLVLEGNLNLETARVSNINIKAEKFSVTDGGSTYSANLIGGYLSDLTFNAPLIEQFSSSTLEVEDISISKLDLTSPKAIIKVFLTENSRNFKIDLQDVRLAEYGSFIENVRADGSFNQFDGLQELQIDFFDGVFLHKLPKFHKFLATINKLVDDQYEVYIEGNIEEFELSDSDNFIGLLPNGNFVVELLLDKVISKVVSTSRINFNTLNKTDIVGLFEVGFSSEPFAKMECTLEDCKLSDFDLSYKINFDDEWVRGSASCAKGFCGLAEMDHLIRTSNTANILQILTVEKILNPLSSLYLYGTISSGQKIDGGHELKFQF